MRRWNLGDEIVLREVWLGRVWTAMPAVVAEDDPDERQFFIPAGTGIRYAVDEQGRELRLHRGTGSGVPGGGGTGGAPPAVRRGALRPRLVVVAARSDLAGSDAPATVGGRRA